MVEPNSERDALEILASEFMERLRQGEDPDIAEYVAAHPELAADIREVFPTVAEAEKLKIRNRRSQTAHPRVHRPGSCSDGEGAAAGERGPDAHESMQLGKYALLCPLGQGSLGTVWLSQHPELGIRVAVKVLRRGIFGSDAVEVQHFLREAHAAALINHPHLVRVFDAGSDQGLYYLVMEYVDGGSVGDLMKQAGGPLAIPRATKIALAVAEALEAAAKAGIVHRDIKPDNILLDRQGTPKLADLGLAKHVDGPRDSTMAATGMGVGTPLYVAPEQAMDGTAVDARADIYSLGATLYHMVTGQPPFSGPTAFRIVHNHLHQPLVDPMELNASLPRGLAQVMVKMLAKSPEERYQTAAEARADLARVATGQAPTALGHRRFGPVLRRAMGGLAAVLAICLGVAVGIRHWRPQPAQQSQALPESLPGSFPRPPSPASGMGPPGREEFPPPGRDGGSRPRQGPERAADGSLRASDWQVLDSSTGRDAFPRSLAEGEYEFDGAVLRVSLGRAQRGPADLIYGGGALAGPFAITLEARNVAACGISAPRDGSGGCRIQLYDPAVPTPKNGRWQRIEIHSQRQGIVCTVDGQPAHAVTGRPSAAGRFSIQLPVNGVCELRAFSLRDLSAGPPSRAGQPPPPHGH